MTRPEHPVPAAFTRACVLLFIAERPGHGYEILERLRAMGLDNVDRAGLYRLLRRLEEEGLVRSRWQSSGQGPDRRTYRVSAKGTRWLDTYSRGLDDIMSVLRRYRSLYRGLQQ